jgi:hypothetical protein
MRKGIGYLSPEEEFGEAVEGRWMGGEIGGGRVVVGGVAVVMGRLTS